MCSSRMSSVDQRARTDDENVVQLIDTVHLRQQLVDDRVVHGRARSLRTVGEQRDQSAQR